MKSKQNFHLFKMWKLQVPSVNLSAMSFSSVSSVSGLVTTIEVSGVTKLYFRERSRAWAVMSSLSSAEHFSLLTRYWKLLFLSFSGNIQNIGVHVWPFIQELLDGQVCPQSLCEIPKDVLLIRKHTVPLFSNH